VTAGYNGASNANDSWTAAESLLHICEVFTALWDVKRFRIIAVSGEGSRDSVWDEEAELAHWNTEAVNNLERGCQP
jgi:hypothetical protein